MVAMVVIFLLMILGQCAGQAELEIRPSGDSFVRALDSNIVFTCDVANIGAQLVDIELRWFNQHGVEIVDVAARGRRMYVEEDGPSTKKLYIHVAREHEGTYTCNGVLEGNLQSKSVRLDLFKDITYDAAPSPQHPTQYDDGLVECRVSGQPIPTVSWRYRGRRLHTGGRYTQDTYGLRIQNVTTDDDGIYYCRAEVDSEGRYKERGIEVIVYIKPTIVPNSRKQFEGEQAQETSIRCSAHGKPDPNYVFYKDGNQNAVHSTDRIQVDGESGTIHFRPQHKDDDGRYRCVAFNTVGETETFIDLTVVVPPTVYNLKNVTQAEGHAVTLVCLSYGDPAPTMAFQKANSSVPYSMGENEGGRIVMSNPTDGRLELLVKGLRPSDMSNYTCQSANKAGVHEKNGTITVNFRPRFPSSHITEIYTWAGKTRNITCHILAEPLPVIEWLHHGQALVNNETYRIYIMSKDTNLQVTVREPDQGWIFGDYLCHARNRYGTGEQKITLRRANIPNAPHAITVRYKSSTVIHLDVEPPDDDGGDQVTGYQVEYFQSRVLRYDIDEDILIEDLSPSTSYVFQIRAVNEVGTGLPKRVTVTTDDVRVPDPLVIISDPFGTASYEFEIAWKKPETGGMPIERYRFQLRKIKGMPGAHGPEPLSDWALRVRDEGSETPSFHYVLRNLDPNTWYQLQVTAENNIGESKPNDLFCFRTGEGDPLVGPVGRNTGCAEHFFSFLTVLYVVAVSIVFSQN